MNYIQYTYIVFFFFLNIANNLGKRTSNLRPPASGQSKRWSAAPMIHDPKEKLRTVIMNIK